MYKRLSIVFITILFFTFLLVPKQSDALSITPAIREITLKLGEEKTYLLELDNDAQETIELTTEVVNFTAKAETGEPQYLDEPATGIATWMEVTEGPIVLAPDQKTEVAVTFKIPTNAEPGGHYGAVLFKFVDSKAITEENQVTIESKMATPFLVTIEGDYIVSSQVATFTTVGNKTNYTEGPVEFILRYQNTGEAHLKPVGNLVITNFFGSEVKKISINTEKGAVLPGLTRVFDIASWEDFGNSFGKYTATVTLTSGTVTNTASVDFWIFSMTGIIIAAVIIIVLIIVIVLLAKLAGRKKSNV